MDKTVKVFLIINAIVKLRRLLSSGDYAICRRDKEPMHLGDAMIVGKAMNDIDDAIGFIEPSDHLALAVLPEGHFGSSLDCPHPYCVAERSL